MAKNHLLTIAIPTYNRAETLNKVLQQLQHQRDKNFTIIVSDNHSEDNTIDVVNKYKRNNPNLIYHKNNKNLGYGGNLFTLYKLAKTRYIWFLSDDDMVCKDSTQNILTALQKYYPTVAIFNFSALDPYGREIVTGVDHDVMHDDFHTFNNYFPLQRLGFLSSLVIEKSLPIGQVKKISSEKNTFYQVSLALELLNKKFRLCEISQVIVHRNVGVKYGEFFKTNFLDFVNAQNNPTIFDKNKMVALYKKQILTMFLLYLSQKLGMFVYQGKITKDTYKQIRSIYGIYSLFIPLFIFFYFVTPTVLLKALYFQRLTSIHGYNKAKRLYKENIQRVNKDTRQGFEA